MLSLAIGPFSLSISHLLLITALGVATLLGWLSGRKTGSNPESTLFGLFLLGLLAARLSFVLVYWTQYSDKPLQALDVRDGGFLVWPGVAVALLAGLWQGQRKANLRSPLLWGLGGGLLFWLLSTLTLSIYHQSTRIPSVTVRNSAGEVVQLADYQGRPIVMNLWATWCPPCRREMPVLQAAQREHNDVIFLFVNQLEDSRTANNFLASQGLELKNLLFDDSGQLARQVGSAALPTTLFYNADGHQAGSHLGELSRASLTRYLEVIKAEQAP